MKKHVASWRAALLLELSSRLTLSIPLVVAMTFICNGLIAQDYSISTAGGALVITDNSNNADALTLSQSGGNIRFAVSPSTRTYSINGGATTAFSTPADVALASLTSITVNAAGGNDIINVGAFTANLPSLTINGGTGDETVNFNGDITFASNANLDVDLQDDDASPGKDALVVASNANLLLSGAGTATVRVSMMVTLNGGGSIETVNGDLTVEANQQATPTTGDFYGIFLSSGTLKTSGAGVLTAKGKGGTASFQYGIIAMNGAQILGGTAPVIVEGTGGPGAGNQNYGVTIQNANTLVSSSGGSVSVTGQGGGTGASGYNYGLIVQYGGQITAGGSGTVTVQGTGGTATGISNEGVYVAGANARITSSGGAVSVTGIGGGSASSNYNDGVVVTSSGEITAGGNGTVTVQGTGGATTGNGSTGVVVSGGNARITSSGGTVNVTGQGGGSGNSSYNNGVALYNDGQITAGGSGTVTVQGTGGAAGGFQNYGVFLFSSTAVITSSGGAVHVIGQGGGLSASGYTNVGVYLQDGGQIAAGSSGTVTVTGMGGLGTGTQHHGVFVRGTNSRISSSGGPVSVIGQGGGSSSSSDNYGVSMFNGGQITAGNGGTVTVQGTGGASGGGINVGVNLDGNNSLITSSGGAVSVTGQGGSGAPGLNYGVYVHNAGQITAGGNGMVTVQGTGGASTGSLNNGVEVRGIGSRITSSGGAVSVTGQGGGSGTSSVNGGINVTYSGEITAGGSGTVTLQGTGGTGTGGSNYGVSVNSNSARVSSAGGSVSVTGIEGSGLYAYGVLVSNTGTITTAANGGNISIFANSMVILSAISTNAAGSVTLAPYTNGISIDLGGNADPIGGPLGLSDAELDRISTGTLIIGNANSGNITVSTAITRPASTNVQLVSGGNVLLSGGGFDTGGGTLLLDPGASPAAIIPTFNGTDAAASALSLAGDLKLVVNGGTAGNGSSGTYTQLNAVGTVDLTGVGLVLSGSYNPAICQTFTLVVNDGTDAIIGTFNGLPEGAVINMAPFTSLNALISYVGGTGNDVVITVSGDINIQGNGTSIVDGDNSPDLLDGTDFGSTPGAPISRTFTIQNTGGAPLSLGAGAITFSGANASLFSVSNVSLPATINSGSSITFDVIYSPSGIGIHAATVNIANNDCDEGAYDFAITAKSCTVPSFTACPGAPVTGNTQTGVCTAVLTYDVSANGAPMPTLAYAFTGATTGSGSGTGSGSTFNGGNTTVTVTATNFCDASTCVFTVTVVDNFPPSIICPANMTLNASTGQCGTIVNYVLPTASDNCSSVSAQLSSGPASGAYFPVGVTNVVWVADDGSNAPAQCNFTVTVVDAQAPTITCPPNQTKAADPGLCTAVITYATPTATDNCTVGDPQRINGLASGSAFPKGPTLVRWKVTDANGLTRTCSFTVTVNDTQAPSITCPSNQTQGTDPGQCTAVVNYTTPTASDNCTGLGYPVNIGGLPSGGIFGKGITIVTWRVTDAVGLTKTCSFKVTITDVQAPVFTSCPANQTVHAVPNACTAVVTYATPTASDNCSAAPAVTRIVGPASGSTFSVGVTQVTWKATDGAGLSSTCAFTVTVDCPGPEPVEEAAETRSPLPQGMGAEAALRLALAPNPASEQVLLTVWGVGAEGGELLVWDGLGRLVWRSALPAGEEQSVLLRVSEAGLSSGVYSVGLRSGDAALTKRLVISR